MQTIAILLFNQFETLDAFGPIEIFGRLPEQYELHYVSLDGGLITSRHGTEIMTEAVNLDGYDIILLPGGQGTRVEVNNLEFLATLRKLADSARFVLSVCTGSGLLAAAGLLDDKVATSNKLSFAWVISNSSKVKWHKSARWCVDDKFYTSSGVSAGMDMSLGFIADRQGEDVAKGIANYIEYIWNQDKELDTFIFQE